MGSGVMHLLVVEGDEDGGTPVVRGAGLAGPNRKTARQSGGS